jgi:hypothetical protein
MASYDQLSAQQRAIVDLILKRGQGYDQLADKLDMPVGRVRELAVEALTNLAPVSARAVDEDWREQLTDYLLNQQQPPEAAATRGHLRRSEPARAWSRSVLDSLEHLYVNGDLPTIPTGDGGGSEPEPPKKKAAARGALSPEAEAIVRRRRAIGIAAIAAALVFIVLIWPVGLLTGGDDDGGGGDDRARARTEVVGAVRLNPVDAPRREADGVATVARTGDKLELSVQAAVPRTKRAEAYEVWLYNSADDARSLGAQVTDAQGNFAGRTPLPANYRDYRFIDISRETVDRNVAHGGNSVLRARIDRIRRPQG